MSGPRRRRARRLPLLGNPLRGRGVTAPPPPNMTGCWPWERPRPRGGLRWPEPDRAGLGDAIRMWAASTAGPGAMSGTGARSSMPPWWQPRPGWRWRRSPTRPPCSTWAVAPAPATHPCRPAPGLRRTVRRGSGTGHARGRPGRARSALPGVVVGRLPSGCGSGTPASTGGDNGLLRSLDDQPAGLARRPCARPGGRLVLVDLFAVGWLRPITALGRRRNRVRTIAELEAILTQARLTPLAWERVYDLGPLPLVRAVIAGQWVQPLAASG